MPGDTSALADAFLENFVVRAHATIARNPDYASVAAGLYMSARIFTSQQVAAIAPLNAVGSMQPVVALPNVSAVKAERR